MVSRRGTFATPMNTVPAIPSLQASSVPCTKSLHKSQVSAFTQSGERSPLLSGLTGGGGTRGPRRRSVEPVDSGPAPTLSREHSFDTWGSMATSHGGLICPVLWPFLFPLAPAEPKQRATTIADASGHLCHLPAQLHAPLVGTGETTALGISESPPRSAAAASALPTQSPTTRLSVSPSREGVGLLSPKPFPSAKMRPTKEACLPHSAPNTFPVHTQWLLLQVLPHLWPLS